MAQWRNGVQPGPGSDGPIVSYNNKLAGNAVMPEVCMAHRAIVPLREAIVGDAGSRDQAFSIAKYSRDKGAWDSHANRRLALHMIVHAAI